MLLQDHRLETLQLVMTSRLSIHLAPSSPDLSAPPSPVSVCSSLSSLSCKSLPCSARIPIAQFSHSPLVNSLLLPRSPLHTRRVALPRLCPLNESLLSGSERVAEDCRDRDFQIRREIVRSLSSPTTPSVNALFMDDRCFLLLLRRGRATTAAPPSPRYSFYKILPCHL